MSDRRPEVVMLPGGVLPARLAYQELLRALGVEVDARIKELEVYASDTPPPGFTLQVEMDGINRFADAAGFDRFHLVGYSAGGASCLAYAARHPDRLLSLALMEPAFAGWQGASPDERAALESFRGIADLPDDEMLPAFVRAQLRDGTAGPAPLPGPPPPWMSTRPAGLRAFLAAFFGSDLDVEPLRQFRQPVYFALGGLSHPHYYALMARRLAGVFPDFTIEVYADRHHFDPPHRVEPERLAKALRSLWARAGPSTGSGPAEIT
jgi:pimeloyl-ACP methyl ester carboxylesterase